MPGWAGRGQGFCHQIFKSVQEPIERRWQRIMDLTIEFVQEPTVRGWEGVKDLVIKSVQAEGCGGQIFKI